MMSWEGTVRTMPDHSVSKATAALAEKRVLSGRVTSLLARQDRVVVVPEIESVFGDPCFVGLMLDASASMIPHRDTAIQAQHAALTTLRASGKCRTNTLYVGQWLASTTVTVLTPFTLLDTTGMSDGAVFDASRYNPDGMSALHQTVFHVPQEIIACLAYCYGQAIRTTFSLAFITGGDDTAGGAEPADIKAIMLELRSRGYLRSSIVYGLVEADCQRQWIETLKNQLGFDRAVTIGRNARDLRRAFDD